MSSGSQRPTTLAIAEVIDGDTVALTNGEHVRLVQIDTPELREGECYASEATRVLNRLLPAGTEVRLQPDERLDRTDRYGRLLRYVYKGSTNVNLALVERGAASVWFFDGDRGRYARQFVKAARAARRTPRGLWRECPGTSFDPAHGVDTTPAIGRSGRRIIDRR